VIAGVEMDLRRDRYETWEDDLAAYCYRVAGAVGSSAFQVFGYRNPSARSTPVELGLAFQLTNILRDVAETRSAAASTSRAPTCAASAAARRTCWSATVPRRSGT